MMPLQPSRPTHIPDYAELCLQALAEHDPGDKISLGGAFGLLHYLDYRETHDVDAWWTQEATPEAREQVISTLLCYSLLDKYGCAVGVTFQHRVDC